MIGRATAPAIDAITAGRAANGRSSMETLAPETTDLESRRSDGFERMSCRRWARFKGISPIGRDTN
jgi:hypothetical protein